MFYSYLDENNKHFSITQWQSDNTGIIVETRQYIMSDSFSIPSNATSNIWRINARQYTVCNNFYVSLSYLHFYEISWHRLDVYNNIRNYTTWSSNFLRFQSTWVHPYCFCGFPVTQSVIYCVMFSWVSCYSICCLLCNVLGTLFFLFIFFSFSYCSGGSTRRWIYNDMCNQCLSPLKLWVRTPFMASCTRYNIMW